MGLWLRAGVCEHVTAVYSGMRGRKKGGAMLLQPLRWQCGHGPCTRHVFGGVGLCDRVCSGGVAACRQWDGMLWWFACMPHAHAPRLHIQAMELVKKVEKQLERHWRSTQC